MNINNKKEQRIFLWAMLISSLSGIGIWYVERLVAAQPNEWVSASITTFSFFTNFSNLIIIVMTTALLYGRGWLYERFKSPVVQAACCLYIAFVGLGFWFLLGGPGELVTLFDWIPELTAHTLSPILGAVYWFRVIPKGQLRWQHPFLWLIYPIVYLVYWLFRGPLVGYYPYFFIDVNALGYSGVAIWSGALVVTFLILGSLMLLVDQRRAAI